VNFSCSEINLTLTDVVLFVQIQMGAHNVMQPANVATAAYEKLPSFHVNKTFISMLTNLTFTLCSGHIRHVHSLPVSFLNLHFNIIFICI